MVLCEDCNNTERPQIVAQVAFKGNFNPPTCEDCEVVLPPYGGG